MKQKTFTIAILTVLMILSIETQAQTGVGISPMGTLNSLNSGITGKVFDAQTLLPITNATITIVGSSQTVTTNHNGRFVIPISATSGYSLSFSAPGYLPLTRTNIIFDLQNLAVLENTSLIPLTEQDFDIVELSPNPNPQISMIKSGGLLKRYYQVVGKVSRVPMDGIEVEFKREDGVSKVFISQYYIDQPGILIVELNQDTDIGCYNCSVEFRLNRVGNTIIPNSPISFGIEVEQREYQKEFEIARDIEIGFGGAVGGHGTAKIGDQTTAGLILKQKYGTSEPYKLGLDISFENWGGIELGVGGGLKFGAGPVTGGIYGSAEGGGYLTFGADGSYLYDYDSPTNDPESRAKLLNLSLAAVSLGSNPFIGRIAFILSAVSSWDYLENIKGGPGVKGSISGEALAGIFTSRKIGLGLGAKLNGSAEQGEKFEYEYNKTNNLHYGSMTLYDKVSLSGGIGLLTWHYSNPGNPNFKKINKIKEKSKLGLTFNIADWNRSLNIKYGGHIYSNPEITIETEVGKSDWRRSLRLIYSHNNLDLLLGTSLMQGIVSLANPYTAFQNIGEVGGGFINNAIDNLLSNIADKQTFDNYPPLNYEIDSSKIDNGMGVHLNLDWKIGISLDLGFNIDWNTTYKSLIEKGVFLGGIEYPLEYYTSIPEVNVPISTALGKIVLDGLRTFSLSEILSTICIFCGDQNQGNQITDLIPISSNGSTLEIELSSLPPGLDSLTCNTWNWYGNSPVSKLSDLNYREKEIALAIKNQQQNIAKMDYGIGGFYKFEPPAVSLSIPAILTIAYADSDIAGVDENNLAIFSQDTSSNQWKYIGGVVDVLNNKVTISVDTLQLYTIAPVMPSGEIGLSIDKDTLVTNETNPATLFSDTLKLVNGQNVGNGVLYTVTVENLELNNIDADTSMAGVQVSAENSILQFQVISTNTPGKGKIFVESVSGMSKGILELSVIDTTASIPLMLNSGRSIDNGAIIYVTNPDTDDIVQFEVHYGLESGGPYLGKAIAGGQDSPFIVGALDSAVISNLINDSTYFVALKSVDRGGNRSEFSNEISIIPTDTLAPGKIEILDFTIMPDSSFLARWIASGDNGNEGTANKYQIRVSNQSIGDTITWWQNASIIDNVTAPGQSGSIDFHILSSIDTTYYLGIRTEDEVGFKSSISIFQMIPNRGTRDLALNEQWNLISYPVDLGNNSMNEVLPYIVAGPYLFDPTVGYYLRDTVDVLKGCWINTSIKYDINLNGAIIHDTLVEVQNGWNIIGGNSFNANTTTIYSQPAGIIESQFWGFDSTGYYDANEIKYGNGYWVKVNQNGFIILPQVNGSLKKKINHEMLNNGFEIMSDGRNRLLWTIQGKDLRKYQAPPLPPGGNFDARFVGDLYAESEQNSTYQIIITNGIYPLQITSLVEDEEYEVIGNITQKIYGNLNGSNSIKIEDSKDVMLTLSKVTVPVEYYLSQNFPNPFNPATIIKFGLPQDQKVRVSVYDILGQEVERLVNDQQLKAGHHTIEWNASKYASGVYLLNIHAGGFNSVKKMMLLK